MLSSLAFFGYEQYMAYFREQNLVAKNPRKNHGAIKLLDVTCCFQNIG